MPNKDGLIFVITFEFAGSGTKDFTAILSNSTRLSQRKEKNIIWMPSFHRVSETF